MNEQPMRRLMRLRASKHLRDLCAETEFTRAQLIQPLFIVEGLEQDEPITGLRGTSRLSLNSALRQVERDLAAGVTQFILFPVPSEKKPEAFDHQFTQTVIAELRRQFGRDFCIWVDTCLCSATTHGHCAVQRNTKFMEGETDRLMSMDANEWFAC